MGRISEMQPLAVAQVSTALQPDQALERVRCPRSMGRTCLTKAAAREATVSSRGSPAVS